MERPNIVYVLADDMGYGDVSCLNENSRFQTVHLDRLASEGMRFGDAHASSAVCTPSRYSILTGRYNWRSWLKQGVTFGYDKPLVELDRMTVASLLQGAGYRTACVGKWHLGWDWPQKPDASNEVDYTQPIRRGPTSLGFDYFFGMSASLDLPPYVYIENDLPTAIPDHICPGQDGKAFRREGPIAPDFRHEEVLTRLVEKAQHFIEESTSSENPFFLYLPLTAPHTPILPSAEFRGKSGTNEYGDFCLEVDAVVGRLLASLEACGQSENTIFVFTSDNGCSPRAGWDELQAMGHAPSYHFRGHKADIYEGGHRVPLLVRWPGQIKPGSFSDETVCLVDLLATCADVLSLSLPGSAGEDSVSNLALWRGETLAEPLREATVHHSIDGSFSLRKGKWKLEMCPGSGGWSEPRPGPECEGLPPLQLYDLETDIGERNNLAAEYPEIVQELSALLERYVREGRSTPGPAQENDGGCAWEQLWWMQAQTAEQFHPPAPNDAWPRG